MDSSNRSTRCSKVLARMKTWVNPTDFKGSKLRGILMGFVVTSTVGEICGYKLMQQDIRAGDLPSSSVDVAIITFALFEALVAPFISWWGYRHRRVLLITYSTVASLCVLSWYFLPEPARKEETKFCGISNSANSSLFLGVPLRTAVRLVLIIVNCLVFVMTRVACWSHGIAYSEEFAPERTHVHYGVLLLARTVPLILGYTLLTGKVETNMIFQTTTFLIGFVPNLIQVFLCVPKIAPIVKGEQKTGLPDYNRSFLTSVGRVVSNSLAMSQIFAMGLLAAALYGYMYNESDIVKVKFNLVEAVNGTVQVTKLFKYFFLMFIVAFAGNLYSKPISMEFRRSSHMKQIIRSTIFVIVAYVVMTFVVRCDHGNVAGMSDDLYATPECSIACGCKPRFREFEPVCVVEQMVTYVSPCHAGCGGEEFIDGIRAYTNCTCSTSGRAVLGACSDVPCQEQHGQHSMLLVIAVTFTLLTFQAQGVLLLRTVDPRDRSVVMGVAWSVVTLITFVCGHLLFMGMRVGMCRWFEADRCHLQTSNFADHVGSTCAAIAIVSLAISIISAFSLRKKNKARENTRL